MQEGVYEQGTTWWKGLMNNTYYGFRFCVAKKGDVVSLVLVVVIIIIKLMD